MADQKNIVSQPPFGAPAIDAQGKMSKPWAVWFRDIYNRVAFKGGNAIDETDTNLEEVALVVNQNVEDIEANADNLTTHVGLESAHGSNGDIVGFNDTAGEATFGLVKRMAAIVDAVDSTASVVVADAAAAPAAYNQAYTQTLADLANANKSAINQVVIDLNAAIAVLNNLLAKSKTSGQMTP